MASLGPASVAQVWTDAFHHADGITVTAGATDPRLGFPGFSFIPHAFPTNLKAVHMALIPKGPHQGKVLVWDHGDINDIPIVGPVPPGRTSPTGFFTYQAYSIVDPSPGATTRFLNFLVPVGPAQFNPTTGLYEGGDMFCSGHCWTQFGDLVVVGGTGYQISNPLQYLSANEVFLFNPMLDSEHYVPPNTVAMPGRWMQDLNPNPSLRLKLQEPRWYPTALLTAKIPRLNNQHAILVAGGQKDLTTTAGSANPTFNNYEALRITQASHLDPTTGDPVLGLATDTFNLPSPPHIVPGPAANFPAVANTDSFWFYPRCHLLTSGQVFMSGFVPVSATGNHDAATWVQGPGVPATGDWNGFRSYGASVHYPNLGGLQNLIVRLGGDDPNRNPSTTNSVEVIDAGNGNALWIASHPMKRLRRELNVVILPDASLLAIGGEGPVPPGTTVVGHLEPEQYKPGDPNGWKLLPPATAIRDYHSTAVLLPDGRVLVGGGDSHGPGWDYEVFSPDYLIDAAGAIPLRPTVTFLNPPFDTDMNAYLVNHGQTVTANLNPLPLGVQIERAVFMAPGSTTHHSDMHQRYYATKAVHQGPGQVLFATPASNNQLPAGFYMLFLVTNTGIPSVATWVWLL